MSMLYTLSKHAPPLALFHCLGAPNVMGDSCGAIRPRPRTLPRCSPVSPQIVVHSPQQHGSSHTDLILMR